MAADNCIDYEELKARALEDEKVRRAYEALETADRLARLCILLGLTPEEIAALDKGADTHYTIRD
jgi:hypothetical protein